jgi:acetyl-CoA C-acetyltransferase
MPSRRRVRHRARARVEKLKDTGYGGLPQRRAHAQRPVVGQRLGAGQFRAARSAYRAKHGVSKEDLKRAIAHVSVKSHANGVQESQGPSAKGRSPMEQCLNAPMIAEPLGLFDCCGVSDGAACAIVTTPEIARAMGKKDLITVKALQLSLSNGLESQHNSWDGSYFHTATHRVQARL